MVYDGRSMGHVYGDSTPFPYDVNFIELIRGAVDCGVVLLGSQHAISLAADQSGNIEQVRKQEHSRLDAMSDAVKLTLTAFLSSSSERMVRTATRILETARGVIESEITEMEGLTVGQISTIRTAVQVAREFHVLDPGAVRDRGGVLTGHPEGA